VILRVSEILPTTPITLKNSALPQHLHLSQPQILLHQPLANAPFLRYFPQHISLPLLHSALRKLHFALNQRVLRTVARLFALYVSLSSFQLQFQLSELQTGLRTAHSQFHTVLADPFTRVLRIKVRCPPLPQALHLQQSQRPQSQTTKQYIQPPAK